MVTHIRFIDVGGYRHNYKSFSEKTSFQMSINKGEMTERIDAVINCTPIRVNNKTKLTNLVKISRIEGYNGK